MSSLTLPFGDEAEDVDARIDAWDHASRTRAVDPRYNVALEASAGTGKTRVLVDRYVNLLKAGVDPVNVLAITFTRKAAAEMRERILATLRAAGERGELPAGRWRELRDRTGDIGISTIDAFCLSLLREFPLEADIDPGFSMADETEVPRFVDEALDRVLRMCRSLAREDENVALVFAQLGDRRARVGLSALLSRRLVAPRVLSRYLAYGPAALDIRTASQRAVTALRALFDGMRGGLDVFLDTGPPEPGFLLLRRAVAHLFADADSVDPAALQLAFARLREHFLTQEGQPRVRMLLYPRAQFVSDRAWQTHRDLVMSHAPALQRACADYKRDLNVLVSRGVLRMFRVAESEYRRTLDAHAALDFADVLMRALDLLRQMEEFSRSRYRLESRYHHVLVDEFQDTSRAQWELVSLLVQSWGEGLGLAHAGPLQPSIFIVGDRKQSIYAFRDADVTVLQDAARHLATLRPGGDVRRSISRSFRAVPQLLSLINDVASDMAQANRVDAFTYGDADRFPLTGAPPSAGDALGTVCADTPEACAAATAAEIVRLIAGEALVRDRDTGLPRAIRPGDIAVLFRSRESHREFEAALQAAGLPSFVYKGLGFFDADEVKDALAVLWYLADPLSDLRAAAFLRSRFVHMPDEGLRALGPRIADALLSAQMPHAALNDDAKAALTYARDATATWRWLVDRVPPSELLDTVLRDSAYAFELRGARYQQARENLKKLRGLIRRIQNRGYVTLDRITAHLDRLALGDESNAAVDARDSVNLMTVHAAKGLEFPVVFVVNLGRGTGNRRDPIRVAAEADGRDASVAVGDYRSDTDEDTAAREREEAKRLLYVALTRARDRLYLGSVLKEGRVQPTRGSLAEVLPSALLDALASTEEWPEWRHGSGGVHRFRRCADGAPPCSIANTTTPRPAFDYSPVHDTAPRRRSVASLLAEDSGTGGRFAGGPTSDRLVGTLVHRLIERVGLDAPESLARRTGIALLHSREAVDIEDHAALVEEVSRVYRLVCANPELRSAYSSGTARHEVSFSMRHEGGWLRGVIDCVIRVSDERIVVLEFKTGRRREAHGAQLEIYRRAAEHLFPGASVHAQLVYAEP